MNNPRKTIVCECGHRAILYRVDEEIAYYTCPGCHTEVIDLI
jgi:hypothetical protein